MKIPMVVEYIKIFHTEDAITGSDGQCISEKNLPAYRAGDLAELRKIGEHFCCSEMARIVKLGYIQFGSRNEEVYRNQLAEVFLRVEDGAQILPDGHGGREKNNTDIPIAYCPFCTQPVLTREIETI